MPAKKSKSTTTDSSESLARSALRAAARALSKKSPAKSASASKTKKTTKAAASKPKSTASKAKAPAKTSTKKAAATKKPATTKKASTAKKATTTSKAKTAASKTTAAKSSSTAKRPAKAAASKPAASKSKAAATKSAPAKASAKKSSSKPSAGSKTSTAAKKPAAKRPANTTRRARAGLAAQGPSEDSFTPYDRGANEDYMSADQLKHFAEILLEWRRDLMEEVDRTMHHMQEEATNFADPNDRATQEEEFSLELRTRDRERKLIRKIDKTLDRIDQEDYGYCDSCGVEIGVRRLEARPTATLCIDCKTLAEIKEKQMGG